LADNCANFISKDVDDNCKSASSDHTNQTAKHMAHVVQILQHILSNIRLAESPQKMVAEEVMIRTHNEQPKLI